MVLKTGCVIDGKICMSQRKIMYFIYFVKTLLIKNNAPTGVNIEPSLCVCGIAHCT